MLSVFLWSVPCFRRVIHFMLLCVCVTGREVCEVCVWSDMNTAQCVTGREVCEVCVWSDMNTAQCVTEREVCEVCV